MVPAFWKAPLARTLVEMFPCKPFIGISSACRLMIPGFPPTVLATLARRLDFTDPRFDFSTNTKCSQDMSSRNIQVVFAIGVRLDLGMYWGLAV